MTAAISLCFGGYKETWRINWIGDALLVLAATIQIGFGFASIYHYQNARADADLLWKNAAGQMQESWLESFSCKIDAIDACKDSMSQYLRERYIPFIALFLLSGFAGILGSIISFFWIKHLHDDTPSPKIDSKEAFEIFVLR